MRFVPFVIKFSYEKFRNHKINNCFTGRTFVAPGLGFCLVSQLFKFLAVACRFNNFFNK